MHLATVTGAGSMKPSTADTVLSVSTTELRSELKLNTYNICEDAKKHNRVGHAQMKQLSMTVCKASK